MVAAVINKFIIVVYLGSVWAVERAGPWSAEDGKRKKVSLIREQATEAARSKRTSDNEECGGGRTEELWQQRYSDIQ